jgi:hypothetical protein
MWSGRVKADGSGLLVVADHASRSRVKLERPTGRATLAPVTTGAGSWDEKAGKVDGAGLTSAQSGLLPGRIRMTLEVRPGC